MNVLLLRPVSFFENFYDSLELIRQEGIVADCVAPDLAMPMVATRDIAEGAATALRARDWSGVAVRELLGPRDLSYAEATSILAERIGKVVHVQHLAEQRDAGRAHQATAIVS